MQEQVAAKVVLLGDTDVGKTSIITRYIKDQFKEASIPTIGAAFQQAVCITKSKTRVVMQVWDTAGQEKYATIAPMYYRSCQCAIICYDVMNELSLSRASDWLTTLSNEQNLKNVIIALVGNKLDLLNEDQQQQMQNKVKQLESKFKIDINMLISAKTGENVADLFKEIAERIVEQQIPTTIHSYEIIDKLNVEEKNEKGRCC